MGARLVSLFGTGPYEAVRYRMGSDEIDEPTALMPQALLELYLRQKRQISSVVVLGTAEAQQYFNTEFRIPVSRLQRELSSRFVFDRVRSGERDDDQRELFSRLVGWLKPEKLDDQLLAFHEEAAPDEIVLDITHGYRPQALIAGAAMTFVLAEAVRRNLKETVPIRVVYGEHIWGQGRDDPKYTAPIWDLTDYVSTTLWTFAVQAVTYGRAGAARILAVQESRKRVTTAMEEGRSGRELQPEGYAGAVGRALEAFADDLAFLRAKSLMSESAPKLVRVLDSERRQELVDRIPALRELLDQLERDARLLDSPNVLDERGLRALVALADVFGRMDRFAEQAAALREAYVTHFGLEHVSPQPFAEPGSPGARSERDAVERLIPSPWSGQRSTEDLPMKSYDGSAQPDLVEQLAQARRVRNDILHMGLRDDHRDAAGLRKELETLTSSLTARLGVPGS